MKSFGWFCFFLGIIIALGAVISGLPNGRVGWNLGLSTIFTVPLIWRGWVAAHPKLRPYVCSNCGIINDTRYHYCGKCGIQLRGTKHG